MVRGGRLSPRGAGRSYCGPASLWGRAKGVQGTRDQRSVVSHVRRDGRTGFCPLIRLARGARVPGGRVRADSPRNRCGARDRAPRQPGRRGTARRARGSPSRRSRLPGTVGRGAPVRRVRGCAGVPRKLLPPGLGAGVKTGLRRGRATARGSPGARRAPGAGHCSCSFTSAEKRKLHVSCRELPAPPGSRSPADRGRWGRREACGTSRAVRGRVKR